jgi:membrane protease YdiL (CAAX protease family)
MSPAVSFAIEVAQYALLIGGLMLLWRLGVSPAARRAPAVLPAWEIPVTDFFLFLWIVICGGLIVPYAAGLWFKHHALTTDLQLIFGTAAFQLGLLAGVMVFKLSFGRRAVPSPLPPSPARPLLAGAAVFLIAMPVILAVGLVWDALLQLCHIPAPKQEAIDLLLRSRDPLVVGGLLVCAIVIAPVTEELIFRAGIFRYARTRLPRWAALLLPAILFGALHSNLASFAPLVALGMVFSLAYERTGRISTTMIAHALFNLTAALLTLAGVDSS